MKDEIVQVLEEQNPWHRTGDVPYELAPSPERPLAELLWAQLFHNSPRRHQLILGPRRVGKTTLLYQTVSRLISEGVSPQNIHWLKMDHPKLIEEQLGDLVQYAMESSGAEESRPAFVMIDEIVYSEKWDNWLKTIHDLRWPVRIAATASASGVMKHRRAESGVGRWEEQYLYPYGFLEFLELDEALKADAGIKDNSRTLFFPDVPFFPESDLLQLAQRQISPEETLAETLLQLPQSATPDPSNERLLRTFMLLGGFPEIISDEQRAPSPTELKALLRAQRVLRSEVIERVLYKDIQLAAEVRNPKRLERLLYAVGGRISELFSAGNLSKDLGIPAATVENYLNHLENAYLLFTLSNYSGNETTTQKRGRKVYFLDGAVRNAALQKGTAPLDDSTERGHLLENLVAASLHILAQCAGIRLYHWRQGDLEVDLIFDDPRSPLAFEVTQSRKPHSEGLSALCERHEKFKGNCYVVRPDSRTRQPEQERPGAIPLDLFLLAVGAQLKSEVAKRIGVFG